MGLFQIGKVFPSVSIVVAVLFSASIYYSVYVFTNFFPLVFVMLLLNLDKVKNLREKMGKDRII